MTDYGYFPRATSILRRVHEERAVGLLYGQRALAIGAIMPLNFIGTRRHSNAMDKPFQRLTHTAKAFETIFFGSRGEADRVLAFVHRLHEDVRGTLPEDAGPVVAGTPYSAFDPALMLWTVAVIADSAQAFYELLVGRLDADERDALWQDYVRFGELFGMPRDVAPTSYAEFRAYWTDSLASADVHLTDEARHVGSAILFEIPVPARSQPAMRVHNLIMLGMLPPLVRELYGVRWTAAHAAAFRSVVAGVRASRPLTPSVVRRGGNTRFFDDVARTERRRRARGETIPGALV
ncbi:MAG: hypothetical protein JWN32_3505 [Solirubrobacterales bacterium]|nr:hypothetical protein [Solirubrobacterales bacterium]